MKVSRLRRVERESTEVRVRPLVAVIVTNIPAPYRIPVYELLDDGLSVDLRVIYTAERERNRHWVLPRSRVRSVILRSWVLTWRGRYIHFSRGMWSALRAASPDVVVTTGFNPPQLLAVCYCVVNRVPHVAQTDGTLRSESRLSPAHRVIRRLVASVSNAFVAASDEGTALQRSYGARAALTHKSPLAIDNARFNAVASDVKTTDLLFAGQLADVKNPLFALAVAERAAEKMDRRVSIAFVGEGPLRSRLEHAALKFSSRVDVTIAGFQQQADLPSWYGRSRVFLFPTSWDPWGLVANEAAAAGLPQIIAPAAGATGELVVDGRNGYVRELEVESWADLVAKLLSDEGLRARLGAAGRAAVADYSFRRAADGLRAAIVQAVGGEGGDA